MTGYLGPNGSGKSTTIEMIVRLIDTTSAEISVNGRSTQHDVIAWKQRLDYVLELGATDAGEPPYFSRIVLIDIGEGSRRNPGH